MKNNGNMSILLRGILKENPVLVLVLGTCPTLATTTNVAGAFGMGIAALVVLLCSNVLISLLRKIIPDNVRIPCYIVIIAGFAGKNSVGKSALDGIGMGLGFTLALCAMAVIREVLGNASFAGMPIAFLEPFKLAFLVKAPGGMLVYGLLIALVSVITHGKAPAKTDFSCAGCPSAANCHTGACHKKGEEA